MTVVPQNGRPHGCPAPKPVTQMQMLPTASDSAAIQSGNETTATAPIRTGTQPRGPRKRAQAAIGCSPVSTRWRMPPYTSRPFATTAESTTQNIVYPNSAPMRGAKIVSPVPTVTDAMIAPGPKTLTSASQPPATSGEGGGYVNDPGFSERSSALAMSHLP